MANPEHLEILRQGVEIWNLWRKENSAYLAKFRNADLSNTNLSGADLTMSVLEHADLTSADLSNANLTSAFLEMAKLCRANLSNANLSNANFSNANLSSANLSNANLHGTILRSANLISSKLSGVDLRRASLNNANFSGADLSGLDFSNIDLSSIDLTGANLTDACLRSTKMLQANLSNAILTGACIADWHIGSSTKLDGVICSYIYRTIDENGNFSGRLPVDPNSNFAPGEFEQWAKVRESALETIDLTFTEGIDWQAFFRSFQELRSQYPSQHITIQGMERKAEGFVIRLEVNQEADKATIETQAKQLYAAELKALEAQYEEQLRLQGEHHTEEVRRMIEAERQEKATLMGIIATMANNQGPKYDLRGSQFAGGLAETVEGDQIGRNQSQQSS